MGHYRRLGCRPADLAEMPKRLAVGREERVLAIRDVVAMAVAADQSLGPAQVAARQGGKQVMLDLVVQPPTEDEVDDPAAADVARRRDLPA